MLNCHPGLSIPEQEEAVVVVVDANLAAKLNGNGASSSLVVEPTAANNKQLNSVSTCSELSEDELYQDVDSCDADHEKEIPRKEWCCNSSRLSRGLCPPTPMTLFEHGLTWDSRNLFKVCSTCDIEKKNSRNV